MGTVIPFPQRGTSTKETEIPDVEKEIRAIQEETLRIEEETARIEAENRRLIEEIEQALARRRRGGFWSALAGALTGWHIAGG